MWLILHTNQGIHVHVAMLFSVCQCGTLGAYGHDVCVCTFCMYKCIHVRMVLWSVTSSLKQVSTIVTLHILVSFSINNICAVLDYHKVTVVRPELA